MLQDVDGVGVIDQGIQAIARGILDLKFLRNSLMENRIFPRDFGKLVKFTQQLSMALTKGSN